MKTASSERSIRSAVTSYRVTDPNTGRLLETYTTDGVSDTKNNHIKHQYNDFGHQESQIQVLANGNELELASTGYDNDGFTVWTDSISGPRQYFAYDSYGRQTHSWQTVSEPGATNAVAIVNVNHYGTDGGVEWTAQYEVSDTTAYTETNADDLVSKLDSFEDGTPDSEIKPISKSESTQNELWTNHSLGPNVV